MAQFCKENFYTDKSTLELAEALLGKVLVRVLPDGTLLKGIINETEAYTQEDPTSHSFRGLTQRNQSMFLGAGHAYIYFTYGMHFCLNISAEGKDRGCAVLVRSILPMQGILHMQKLRSSHSPALERRHFKGLCDGPAKLCQALSLAKKENGLCLWQAASPLYLEDAGHSGRVTQTQRIGVSKAKDYPWRFLLKLSPPPQASG